VRAWVDENNSATTPQQFVDGATSYGGTAGMSIIRGRIETQQKDPSKKTTIEGISKFYNFEFQQDDKVRVWQAYRVGEGKLVPLQVEKHLTSSFETIEAWHQSQEEDLANPLSTNVHWKTVGDQVETVTDEPGTCDDTAEQQGDDEQNESLRKIYSCTEEGCIKTYQVIFNLE
jgi:hypothetical protein